MNRDNGMSETERDIRAVCNEIAEMLVTKNRSYGDSAMNPVRIFSRAPVDEQLNVRMDDKLSRLAHGDTDAIKVFGEDVEKDLLGYLILKRVSLRRQKVEAATMVNTAAPAPLRSAAGERQELVNFQKAIEEFEKGAGAISPTEAAGLALIRTIAHDRLMRHQRIHGRPELVSPDHPGHPGNCGKATDADLREFNRDGQ